MVDGREDMKRNDANDIGVLLVAKLATRRDATENMVLYY